MAGSAVEEAWASADTGSSFRRLSDMGRAKAPEHDSGQVFPHKSVGFFLEQRVQKQQRKGDNSGSQPASPALVEDILKRLRGTVSDEASGTEHPDTSEQPNRSGETDKS